VPARSLIALYEHGLDMVSMRHAPIKFALALAVAGLGAATVAACGNDLPPNAVAKVGDTVITQDEFDQWLDMASSQAQAAGGAAVTPDPPQFKKCVAAKKKQPLPQGQKEPSAAALKDQCKQEYDTLRSQVMQFLIQSEWVQQEAAAQNVSVSDKEAQNSLEQEKKRAFPGDKDGKQYQEFLKTSGMSEKDVLFRIKLERLQQKLTEKVTKDAQKVTDSEVAAYYEKNKKRFAQPERRDLLVVLTKQKAQAEQAKNALDDGQSWKQVVKRYSIDEASKAQGGKLPGVTEGQNEPALDKAIFAAKKGQVEGPVKTQFGWEVFEVEKITPASQQSLDEAKGTIENLLRSQGQQKALDKFVKDFRKQYKSDTKCAEDYRVAECENAPKQKTDTGQAVPGTQQPPEEQPVPQEQP
jgi:foldase protein PrsA